MSLVHHVNGCRQMQRLEFDHWLARKNGYYKNGHRRHPEVAALHPGQPGVEWWRPPRKVNGTLEGGVLVKILGPKPGCVEDAALVTCCNCLAKLRTAAARSSLRRQPADPPLSLGEGKSSRGVGSVLPGEVEE
jgi:hypothetical protein